MRHAARLARLEKLSGKYSCPLCRLTDRPAWPDPARPKPPDPGPVVESVCKVCGACSAISLALCDEGSRPLWRLFLERPAEDTYTDPTVWAAFQWVAERSDALRARKEAKRGDPRPVSPAAGRVAQSPESRLLKRLEGEMVAALGRMRARQAKRHGETPFPELEARIEAAKGPDYGDLYRNEAFVWAIPVACVRALQRESDAWERCAEAERIGLGEVLAATAQESADCERRALEIIAEARREHEARAAERRERAAEREYRTRGRQEDRSRPRRPTPATAIEAQAGIAAPAGVDSTAATTPPFGGKEALIHNRPPGDQSSYSAVGRLQRHRRRLHRLVLP